MKYYPVITQTAYLIDEIEKSLEKVAFFEKNVFKILLLFDSFFI